MHSGLLKCGTNGIQFGCLGQSRREQSTFFSPSLYDVSLSLCMEAPLPPFLLLVICSLTPTSVSTPKRTQVLSVLQNVTKLK